MCEKFNGDMPITDAVDTTTDLVVLGDNRGLTASALPLHCLCTATCKLCFKNMSIARRQNMK